MWGEDMKNVVFFFALCVLLGMLSGCAGDLPKIEGSGPWDCSVSAVNLDDKDVYEITYSRINVKSESGTLTLDNRNDFPITVHLMPQNFNKASKAEEAVTAVEGGQSVPISVEKDLMYEVGVHADVPDGTEVKLTISDSKQ